MGLDITQFRGDLNKTGLYKRDLGFFAADIATKEPKQVINAKVKLWITGGTQYIWTSKFKSRRNCTM